MIPYIYLAILVAWIILVIGFVYKDYAITALGSILILVLGVYMLIYGINGVSNSSLEVMAFGFTHIGIGAYIFIRGAYELYKGS